MTCPRCCLPCPANEMACFGQHELCWCGDLPGEPHRPRNSDRVLPSYAMRKARTFREDLRRITNQEVQA